MTLLIGALTLGFILSLLALGVFISFRIFDFPDITADGSITLGAALAALLLVKGVNPVFASAAAFAGGFVAGTVTATLATKFKINRLLAGILVMTALYSITLHIMGKSNVALFGKRTLSSYAERFGTWVLRNQQDFNLLGWPVRVADVSILITAIVIVMFVGLLLYMFFQTNLGAAMRATGNNSQMARALGVNDEGMIILGLAISNGLIGLAGAFLAQYQGFADIQMGIGMIVWGLASVIIGEALVGTPQTGMAIIAAVMGSVLFRLMVAIALRLGLDPNDLKLITAAFVIIIGTNGSGKSTMLNAVGGTFYVDSGVISLDGTDITNWPEYRRAKLVGRVFQNPFSGTAPDMSVAENLALAARRGRPRRLGWLLGRHRRAELSERVSQLKMGLENRLDDPIGGLSGGQRQALTLLMATWLKPELLLLDEHTAALDPKSADQVIALTDEIVKRENLTTLMVTHSMHQAANLGNRLIMMHRGSIVQDFRGAEKLRIRVDDLLARFEEVRRADQLDETAAEMLRRV